MEYKPPLTIDQQIDHLKKDKRVVFNEISEAEAKDILARFGYINVITPFKYLFARREGEMVVKDSNGHHIYPREVEFKEYFDAFETERIDYSKIYCNIMKFEQTFNSAIAYECIHYYDLHNTEQFGVFIHNMQNNIKTRYSGGKCKQMLDNVSHYRSKINDFDSIYIFMDRLTFNEEVTIFDSIDNQVQQKIFTKLLSENSTLGQTRLTDFKKMLPKLVRIRNYVFHGNSLTVLVRYHNVKEKKFRDKPTRQSFRKLIKKLSV